MSGASPMGSPARDGRSAPEGLEGVDGPGRSGPSVRAVRFHRPLRCGGGRVRLAEGFPAEPEEGLAGDRVGRTEVGHDGEVDEDRVTPLDVARLLARPGLREREEDVATSPALTWTSRPPGPPSTRRAAPLATPSTSWAVEW